MRRRILFLAIGLLALGGLAPLAASSGVIGVSEQGPCSLLDPVPAGAGAPFGYQEGKSSDGGNAGGGVLPIQGWALDNNGVKRVDIWVDGIRVGDANYGRARPDVAKVFPGFPDSAFAGWEYQLNTTQFPNGLHTVTPQVISNAGEIRDLNSKVYEFTNLSHDLRPFGKIDTPNPNVQLFGTCNDPFNPERRLTAVTGWALDLGVETNDGGMGYVELLLDGAILYNSRLHCSVDPATGYNNCYGLPRLDIERQFPFAYDAPNAGFRFILDVGELIDEGRAEGHHVVTIRGGDQDNQIENIDSIPVVFLCQDDDFNEGSFGEFDDLPTRLHAGTIRFTGWALDAEGVRRVEIYVDGVYRGDATYGLPRAEVSFRNPGLPDSAAPAWVFFFDSVAEALSDGRHDAQAFVVDRRNQKVLVGEITFLTDNTRN